MEYDAVERRFFQRGKMEVDCFFFWPSGLQRSAVFSTKKPHLCALVGMRAGMEAPRTLSVPTCLVVDEASTKQTTAAIALVRCSTIATLNRRRLSDPSVGTASLLLHVASSSPSSARPIPPSGCAPLYRCATMLLVWCVVLTATVTHD